MYHQNSHAHAFLLLQENLELDHQVILVVHRDLAVEGFGNQA